MGLFRGSHRCWCTMWWSCLRRQPYLVNWIPVKGGLLSGEPRVGAIPPSLMPLCPVLPKTLSVSLNQVCLLLPGAALVGSSFTQLPVSRGPGLKGRGPARSTSPHPYLAQVHRNSLGETEVCTVTCQKKTMPDHHLPPPTQLLSSQRVTGAPLGNRGGQESKHLLHRPWCKGPSS